MLRERPHVRARVAERYRHVLVDELADLGFAPALLVELLAAEHDAASRSAADDDQAARRLRAAATKNVRDFELAHPDADDRAPGALAALPAARARRGARGRRADRATASARRCTASPAARVRFWRAADERAQAQAVAAEVERLVRDGCAPERIGVLVRSLRDEGRDVAVAFEERAIGFRTVGEADFFARAEVRDVLAWLRLLADPNDAGAVVRALGRPPVSLRSVDLARCVQIARRRKLDMVSALRAATESPQLEYEARERIHAFLRLLPRVGGDARLRSPRPLRAPPRSSGSGCAASRSSARRPTSSSGSCTSRASASSRAPTRAARRTRRRATSPATSPRSRRPSCATRTARARRRPRRRAGHGARRRRRARARLGLRARAWPRRGCPARACAPPSRSPTRCCARRSAPTTARRTSRRCGGCCTRR